METLIVHTNTKEELKIVKGIMKALRVKYEESPYNPEFVAKINKGKADVKAGRTTKISIDEIWK
jgi:hypothetical protein